VTVYRRENAQFDIEILAVEYLDIEMFSPEWFARSMIWVAYCLAVLL
jgi:hypothetical protein